MTSLQDHANQIEKLAQKAYIRTDKEDWQSMAYEAFFRTLNNAALQCYFLTAKLNSIEVAVKMEKAYYQG